MRVYSQLLKDAINSHPDQPLFNFEYEMADEYKPIFERKFLLRYGYRNISYDSYQMFRHMLESKLIELMPKYLLLYQSVNVEFNPFINTQLDRADFRRVINRGKRIEINNSKNHGYNSNSNSNSFSSEGGTTSGYNENRLTSNNTIDKQRGISDSGNSAMQLNSDTPQTPISTQGAGGGGIGNDTGESAKYFNDGYITTAQQNKNSATNINAGSSNGWGNEAEERGQTAYGTNGEKGNTIAQGQSKNGGVSYSDHESVDGRQYSDKGMNNAVGLSGVLTSTAVMEWRKSFINVDKMLLDDLEPLFMGIY